MFMCQLNINIVREVNCDCINFIYFVDVFGISVIFISVCAVLFVVFSVVCMIFKFGLLSFLFFFLCSLILHGLRLHACVTNGSGD